MTETPAPRIVAIPDGYRFVYPDGTALEVSHITRDPQGRLLCDLTARERQGALVNKARINLLDQRQRIDFHGIASAANGPVDWHARMLPVLEHLATDDGRADEEPLSSVVGDAVEAFPVDVFPLPLRRLIEEGSRALPCPPDFLGAPVLATLGVAIGTSRVLEVKPGWVEGPRVYTGVIADPGSKKSPAIDLIVRPVYRHQERLHHAYQELRTRYDEEIAHFEMDLADWKKARSARKASRQPRPLAPEEPVLPQIWTSDSTMEALAELLQRNPRGIFLVRDELSGWARSMNQYKGGRGTDLQAWLSLWNGAPVIVNRKSRKEPIILNNPLVCVAGCLPPDVLSDLTDEREREDGFIHRILFAYPDPIPLKWSDASVAETTEQAYDEVVRRLLSLEGMDLTTPKSLTFTPTGRRAFVEFAQTLYSQLNSPECPSHLRGPWAKLEGYCARLALILQLSRYAAGETIRESVEEEAVLGAAALVHYFQSHSRRVYAQLRSTPEDKQIAAVLAWVNSHGGTISAREVVTNRVGGVKTASEARALLSKLDDRGYGSVKEESKHRITFTTYTI